MHYEPVSFKPLLFVPTTFNDNPSTGIACLDEYIGANPPADYKPATNIRGKLLNMGADAKCPPTIKGDIQKFDQYCQRLSLLSLEFSASPQSVKESSAEYPSPVVGAPDNTEHLRPDDQSDNEDISGDDIYQGVHHVAGQEEENQSSSDDDDEDVDAYIEYLYPDTSLHRSQIDLQPLPQVSYASAPVYFTNPFTPSETIEPFESFDPAESSYPKKRPKGSSKATSISYKKAKTHHPSASTSTSTSSSSFSFLEYDGNGNETGSSALSEFPPGHPKSPFNKVLCKDGSYKYTCRKCPDFSTRATGDMRRHMESLAHKPKKDHICRCGGSFTRKDALKRHQLSKKHFV